MFENYSINDLIDILLKRLWMIITFMLIFGIIAFLFSTFLMTKVYTSSTSMYVYNSKDANTQPSQLDFMISEKLVSTYMVIIKSDPVLDAVAEKVKLGYSSAQIDSMINVTPVNDTEVFNISVSNPNPAHAVLIAQTIAEVAPPELKRVVKAGSVEIVNVAKTPKKPSSPNILNNTVAGIVIGLILAIALAFILEKLNIYVKNEEDLLTRYNLPVLGSIPELL